MGLWKLLTEPSQAVRSAHHRRQSRLMAAVLVVLIPAYVVMAVAAGVTRPESLSAVDVLVGVLLLGLTVTAYVLNRTRHTLRGAVVLSLTAIVGPTVVALREPDGTRALYSALIAVTGPLYASFFLSARSTLWLSLAMVAGASAVIAINPALSGPQTIVPVAFALFVLGLTIVGAVLRERQVEELEGGAGLLRSTLDAAPDAAIILDGEGRVAEWSQLAARLLGVSQLDATGRLLRELVRAGDALDATDGRRRFEFTATRVDGTSFPCECLVAPLPDGRAAVFLRDVSERKQIEARLMMSDRLETMGHMVAGVAHEINNPLAYVTANLNYLHSLATEGPLEQAEVRTVLDETLEGAGRIRTIVQDLRIFSRSGEFEQVTPVEIEAVIDSVVTIALPRLREARAKVTREYSGVGPVYGIESRLAQVFLNLIVNAAQALGEAERREIVVSTRRDAGRIIVGVRDFGPGIPPDVKLRLFSPFFTTKPAGQGTGLGLYISQNIVTALKGELRLAPCEEGALFEVVLPAIEPQG